MSFNSLPLEVELINARLIIVCWSIHVDEALQLKPSSCSEMYNLDENVVNKNSNVCGGVPNDIVIAGMLYWFILTGSTSIKVKNGIVLYILIDASWIDKDNCFVVGLYMFSEVIYVN